MNKNFRNHMIDLLFYSKNRFQNSKCRIGSFVRDALVGQVSRKIETLLPKEPASVQLNEAPSMVDKRLHGYERRIQTLAAKLDKTRWCRHNEVTVAKGRAKEARNEADALTAIHQCKKNAGPDEAELVEGMRDGFPSVPDHTPIALSKKVETKEGIGSASSAGDRESQAVQRITVTRLSLRNNRELSPRQWSWSTGEQLRTAPHCRKRTG